MLAFANAKINLGLKVLDRRPDGYHNIETVFYPVKLYDILEIIPSKKFQFVTSGNSIPGRAEDNLCVKAYNLITESYQLPPIELYLHKNIPIGGGLGGGSADAAFLILLLSDYFNLNLTVEAKHFYANQLGADCGFFMLNNAAFASGIGNILSNVELDLSKYHIVLVNPNIHVSTAEAYGSVAPSHEGTGLLELIKQPISEWSKLIYNDFEKGIFDIYPEIGNVKRSLYNAGATYASMSGSGSVVYGIFESLPDLKALEAKYSIYYC